MQKLEIKQLFEKIYRFKKCEDWNLPDDVFTSVKWNIPSLQSSKQELNETKGLLSGVNLEEWSRHTKARDPSSFVIQRLKQNFYPELLTQAWCKFYECLNKFPVVPSSAIKDGVINSLHLCEAPGAFICALNHFLKSISPNIQLNWIANTLNPNYEGNPLSDMIPDDRLIKYTLKNWCFGKDLTGDIRQFYNYTYLLLRINDSEKRTLVTADGSVDCMDDPGNQESHVAHLHYCETITALSVLEKGGSFVLKIFTMFEDSTINLMYLLNFVFEEVNVFKPCSSKSGNSEVYVICLLYKGIEVIKNVWEKLLMPYKSENFEKHSMFDLEKLPHSFLLQIHECSDYFKILQIKTINDNIYYFHNKSSQAKKVHYIKITVAQKYINKYKLKRIPNDQKIVPDVDVLKDWRNLKDDFKYDKEFQTLCVSDLLRLDLKELEIIKGKPITKIKNSKFITQLTIDDYFNKNTNGFLYNLSLKCLSKAYTVFDIRMFSLQNQSEFQKNFYFKITEMDYTKDIIFINIPFLTHFLVGILYILVKAFTEISFNKNGVLILKKINVDKINDVKGALLSIRTENDVSSIIHIMPPDVFDKNPLFFKFVWCYNNYIKFQ